MTPTRWGMAVALLAGGLLVWWQQDEAASEQQRLATEQAQEKAALAASQAGQPAYGLRDLFSAVDQPLPRGPAASAASSSSNNPWQLASASTTEADAGSGSAPPDLSAEDKAVNESLRRLGYQIDERYYRMPLGQLRQAAASKDVQALTHLAERYLFALDGRPQEAEHEPGFPYREAARSALTEAYLRGNRHAAAMISETFLLEKKPLDAAAWNLIARRAGDELSADWFLKTQDYLQLDDAGRQAAAEKAEALWAQLEGRKKNGA